jgi:histidyl-tRNA synthetase
MNIITPRVLSGFPEYLPQQQIQFNTMLRVITEVFERYGFLPIETPAIELAEVLLAKGGGETEKEIYRFSKGDKELALHYDLTVPLARYVAGHYSDLAMPFRRYQIQKNWRAERPQKGRFREFYQCDVDIIGSDSVLHDAEVVAVVSEIFNRLQIGKFKVRISNRKLLYGFVESIGLGKKAADVLHLVDKLEKIGSDALVEELSKLGLNEEDSKQVLDFVSMQGTPEEVIDQLKGLSIDNKTFVSGLEEVEKLFAAIKSLGVEEQNYSFDLNIIRGLDYYTGTVYETILIDYPEFGSVCSGGRYNDLAKYYTKTDLPGVGISIGLTRLFACLQESNLLTKGPSTTAEVLVATFGGNKPLERALQVATELREHRINTQVYLDDAKIEKQFKYADKLSIPYVIVIGEAEAVSGKVVLKEMRSGEQAILEINEVIEKLGN